MDKRWLLCNYHNTTHACNSFWMAVTTVHKSATEAVEKKTVFISWNMRSWLDHRSKTAKSIAGLIFFPLNVYGYTESPRSVTFFCCPSNSNQPQTSAPNTHLGAESLGEMYSGRKNEEKWHLLSLRVIT